MSTEKEIRERWKQLKFDQSLQPQLGTGIQLSTTSMECLKESSRSQIWKVAVERNQQTRPMILKIYASSDKHKNQVELNLYQHAYPLLRSVMPTIYAIEKNVKKQEIWMLMEFVPQLRGQIKMAPDRFDKIIPTIAKLHGTTFEKRIAGQKAVLAPWLPFYDGSELVKERTAYVEETKVFLEQAMRKVHLKEIIAPSYAKVQRALQKGPRFFPELQATGNSIIHGDLHMQNMSCHDVSEEKEWQIKLIDWETAKFATGWFDMAVLVEILLDFRKDWHKNEVEIRQRAVDVYTKEIAKYGVTFKTNPLALYKMAYLQRTLEKGLHTHLRRELEGRPGVLLKRYLDKIVNWGPELGLM